MEKESSTNVFLIVMLSVCGILITLIIIGFVVFSNRDEKVIEEEENGASIVLNYSSNISGLQIRNASKKDDNTAKLALNDGEYFDFSVDVLLDNAASVEYEISAVKDSVNSTIPNEDIKIYLEKEKSGSYTKVFGPDEFKPLKKKSDLGSKKGSMVLLNVKKTNSNSDNYRLRMWLSDKSKLDNGSYSVDIEVNGVAK